MRAFVTGVAGFIGPHVARAFLERGWDVSGCDDLSVGRRENVPDGVTWWAGSVEEFRRVECDVVVHLAAIASARWPDDGEVWRRDLGLTAATLRLSDARFVFASSAAAVVPGSSAYAGAKWASERLVLAERGTVLRYANVYGPGGSGVLSSWDQAEREGRPLCVTGDGSQTRDFIHVEDVARVTVAAAVTGGAAGMTVDVCSGTQRRICDVADSFNGEVAFVPRPDGEPDAVVQDPTLAERLFGFRAEVPFLERAAA